MIKALGIKEYMVEPGMVGRGGAAAGLDNPRGCKLAKKARDQKSVDGMNKALIYRFRDFTLALEGGFTTSGNQEDMEGLVEHLEMLAREIREWAGLKAT